MNLSSLIHSTKRLEREGIRAGILDEPDEDLVEPTEQEWRVLKDATDTERLHLLTGGLPTTRVVLDPAIGGTMEMPHVTDRRFKSAFAGGLTLTKLVGRADAEDRGEDLPPLRYDPAALAFVLERVQLRRRLKLPHHECIRRESGCLCLRDVLDEFDEADTRRDVLKRARAEHKARQPQRLPPPLAPKPEPSTAIRQKPEPVAAAPKRELVTETRTRPFRAIRKTKRWYDPDERRSILDLEF